MDWTYGPNEAAKTCSIANRVFVFSLVHGGQSKPLCNHIDGPTFGHLANIGNPRILKKTIAIVLNLEVYFFFSRSQFELFQFIDRRNFKIVRKNR